MNGYNLMADSYRKMVESGKMEKEVAEKEIRIYDFLATCDNDDLCRLVDSGAFNDIIKAYIEVVVNLTSIDNGAKSKVITNSRWIFDEVNAKEALAKYYGKE